MTESSINLVKKNITAIIIALIFIIVIGILIIIYIFKFIRRIKSTKEILSRYKNKKVKGIAVHNGDGDGFRFYHTPMFRKSKYHKGCKTIPIRIAGIDAPEVAKYGIPAQPLAKESKKYLAGLILNKKVSIKVLNVDVHDRVLASVYVRKGVTKINVGVEMVKAGMACVYIGRMAEYDNYKELLVKTEKTAKKRKAGMWGLQNYVSPMDYKKMGRNKPFV